MADTHADVERINFHGENLSQFLNDRKQGNVLCVAACRQTAALLKMNCGFLPKAATAKNQGDNFFKTR
jgi:hypothetical protein